MTLTSDPHPALHDWQSREYVEKWIASSNARQATRHPELRRLAGVLPCSRTEPIRVLDVGGGHGELTNQVLEEWPNAQVTLQDFSGPMLEIAAERFANYGDRVQFSQSDLTVPGWTSSLSGPFDVAVSAIAIHNVDDPKIIRSIYSEIYTVLRPSGAFLNLDYLFMAGPAMSDLYGKLTGKPTSAGAAKRDQTSTERASLINQLRWLEEMGFDEVDCLWKEGRQAVLCGIRHS